MKTDNDDRLPVWWLCRSADMPQHLMLPLLHSLGLPVSVDPATGEVYSSRSQFRDLLLGMSGDPASRGSDILSERLGIRDAR